MLSHLINELMNLLAGNSRYIQYSRLKKSFFILLILLFVGVSVLLFTKL